MTTLRIIYILWLREIKRYYRARSRIVGSLAQPVLFLVALGYGLGPVFNKAGQGNYINFLVPGVIGMSIIFTAIFSGVAVIWDRQFGFLRETLVAPVSRLSIMAGRTLGGATVATGQGIVVFFIAFLIGFRPAGWFGFIPAVFVMFLIAILFTALGTGIAARMKDIQGFQLIMNFLVMPVVFLSNAFFPLKGLPPALNIVVAANPFSYGVDALRGFLSGATHFAVGIDIAVLAATAVVFLVIGGYLFSTIEA